MSVVLFKREGDKVTIAADRITCSECDGFTGESEKLFKFDNGIVMGETGSCDAQDLLVEYFSDFNVNEFKKSNKKTIMLTKEINDFICNHTKSFEKYSALLLIVSNKIYLIEIKEGNARVYDISDRKYFGIGYYEMPMGAVIVGTSPKDAILACSEYNIYYGKGVTEIETILK